MKISRRIPWGKMLGYPVMLVLSLAAIVFLFATFRNTVADPDIWWHLRDADHLVHTGTLPRVDSYSFTVAGKPWMDSEWLSELPFWLAWRWAGERGLFFITVFLVQTIVLGIYHLSWLRVKVHALCSLDGYCSLRS